MTVIQKIIHHQDDLFKINQKDWKAKAKYSHAKPQSETKTAVYLNIDEFDIIFKK